MNAPQQQALPSGNGGATNGNGNGASTAVAKRPPSKVANLKDYLEKCKGSVAAALPKHMTPERMFGIVVAAASRNPELLECTLPSIAQAVMQCAELGLMPGALLGEAYLIPRKNTKVSPAVKECVLVPGYKGLLKLARQSGIIQEVTTQMVFKDEVFEVEFGLEPRLKHIPNLAKRVTISTPEQAQEHVLFVYAVAKFKDGGHAFEVMTLADVEAIRKREDKEGRRWGPWKTDYGQMMRKTAIRRVMNYCPKSPDEPLTKAVNLENAADQGGFVSPEEMGFTSGSIEAEYEVVDGETGEVIENGNGGTKTATESLKDRMKAQG